MDSLKGLEASGAAVPSPAADAPEGKISILLVDDLAANLLALENLLADPGYELVKAQSGADALRWLLKRDFALVLLDVFMPGMDGFDTAALIRRRRRSHETPIIFISAGSTNDNHVSRGYSIGAADYIYKPIVPEILKAKVQVFAELHRKSQRLARSEEALRLELAEHKRAEEAQRESEARYRELFSRASDAILLFDGRGAVLDANAAALRLFGLDRRRVQRLTARGLGLLPEGAKELAAAAAAARKPLAKELAGRGGKPFPAEVSYGAIQVKGETLVMALVRDVTERRQAEEAERLREREAMQRRFVATVSHELRTPIAVIKASAETVRLDGPAAAKRNMKFVRIIENHADRLGWLVEDLLVLAEFEAGMAKPQPREVELSPFVEQFAEGLKPLADRRDVSIRTEVEPGLTVFADQPHVSRILQNLLDNAIKYNRKGGTVTVSAKRTGARQAELLIRDTGIGIAAEELPKIFDQFHRTQRAKATSTRGTGLGLYIIKSLVESNGGRIWAESVLDQGTTFHVVLPLAKKKA